MSDFDEKTRVTQVVQAPPSPEPPARETDFLVVIHPKEPILGKRFVLDRDRPTRVGRGVDNDIVLDGDSVSRKHAHFEFRAPAWRVIDDGSTNGTYHNHGQIIGESWLNNGDRVKIGATIFKFFSVSAADVESQYHEEIYRLTIFDGLTQVHNKRYFCQALEQEIRRSRRHDHKLAVLMFDIDHMKRINDVHGHFVGDYVLQDVARIILPRLRGAVLGRYGGDEFCAFLPDINLKDAARLAEMFREQVEEHEFRYQSDRVKVRVSIGVATLDTSDGSGDLIRRADDASQAAKRLGRNRVHAANRPILDGPTLIEKALLEGQLGRLLAFEIRDEAAIVQQLSSKIYEEWFHDLVRDVEASVGAHDWMGTWHGRYVLVLARDTKPEAVDQLIAAVQSRWTGRPIAPEQQAVSRQLRFGMLSEEEFFVRRERALDFLVGRLLQQSMAQRSHGDELPFPVAALRPMVSARRTALGRVKSLLDAIEVALRFATAIELAAIRRIDNADRWLSAAKIVMEARSRGTQWGRYALDLAALVSGTSSAAIREMAENLNQERSGGMFSALVAASRLWDQVISQTAISEDAYRGEEGRLQQLLERVVLALGPLATLPLVSVAEIEDICDDGSFRYALYLHRGAGEHFPIVREPMPFRIQKGWCYLFTGNREDPPLCLAPIAVSRTCVSCGRIEVAIAEKLIFGPKGTQVPAQGITSHHEGLANIPWQDGLPGFYELLEDLEGASNPATRPTLTITHDRPSQASSRPTRDHELTMVDIKRDALRATRTVTSESASSDDVTRIVSIRIPKRVVLLSSRAADDVTLREEFTKHLSPAQQAGLMVLWHEGQIEAGEHSEQRLQQEVETADILLLLLTHEFLADTELVARVRPLVRSNKRVVPVLASRCLWEESEWGTLEPLPKDRRPIASCSDRHAAWNDVASALATMLR